MDAFVKFARQQEAVHVTGEVTFHREIAWRKTRRMAERQYRPIAEQDTGEPDPETLRGLEVEGEDELSEHAREADASEHATETHVLESLPLESVVIDDAEQDEDQAALDDLPDDFRTSPFRQTTRQRIRR